MLMPSRKETQILGCLTGSFLDSNKWKTCWECLVTLKLEECSRNSNNNNNKIIFWGQLQRHSEYLKHSSFLCAFATNQYSFTFNMQFNLLQGKCLRGCDFYKTFSDKKVICFCNLKKWYSMFHSLNLEVVSLTVVIFFRIWIYKVFLAAFTFGRRELSINQLHCYLLSWKYS